MSASRISKVVVHPLRATLPKVQRTSQGDYPAIEIVVVEVETQDGFGGFGEGLCRRGAAGYARFIEEALVPRLIGRNAADRRALWKTMRAALSGRPGGQIVEAIAAVDIALWDIAGKQAGQPIHRLLGGMGRKEVAAYASSINWLDDATVEAEVAAVLKAGFREIKVKLGHPVDWLVPADNLVALVHHEARPRIGIEFTLDDVQCAAAALKVRESAGGQRLKSSINEAMVDGRKG